MAFHALMVTIRLTIAPSSAALNTAAACAKSASGTCVLAACVTDSASASAPRGQRIQALLGLACGPRVLGVHVYAVRAPVELRGPDADQFAQQRVDAGP